MGGHCGIGAWLANSVIVHSTSKDPHGLYQRDGVVFPTFSHEPTVVRAPSGEFVMFFSSTIWNGHPGVAGEYLFSNGQPPTPGGFSGYCACTDGSTPGVCGSRNWSMPLPTYMSWTHDPANSSSWSRPVVRTPSYSESFHNTDVQGGVATGRDVTMYPQIVFLCN